MNMRWHAVAATLPAFVLAAALTGLGSWALPGPWQATLVPGLLVFVALWIGLGAAAFAVRRGGLVCVGYLATGSAGIALLHFLAATGTLA